MAAIVTAQVAGQTKEGCDGMMATLGSIVKGDQAYLTDDSSQGCAGCSHGTHCRECLTGERESTKWSWRQRANWLWRQS